MYGLFNDAGVVVGRRDDQLIVLDVFEQMSWRRMPADGNCRMCVTLDANFRHKYRIRFERSHPLCVGVRWAHAQLVLRRYFQLVICHRFHVAQHIRQVLAVDGMIIVCECRGTFLHELHEILFDGRVAIVCRPIQEDLLGTDRFHKIQTHLRHIKYEDRRHPDRTTAILKGCGCHTIIRSVDDTRIRSVILLCDVDHIQSDIDASLIQLIDSCAIQNRGSLFLGGLRWRCLGLWRGGRLLLVLLLMMMMVSAAIVIVVFAPFDQIQIFADRMCLDHTIQLNTLADFGAQGFRALINDARQHHRLHAKQSLNRFCVDVNACQLFACVIAGVRLFDIRNR